MINPGYYAIGALYDMQARRRLDDDWDDIKQFHALTSGRSCVIPLLHGFGAWFVAMWSRVRSVGAYGAVY